MCYDMKNRGNYAALWALFTVIALLAVSNAIFMYRLDIMKLTTKASAQGTIQLTVEGAEAPAPTPTPTTAPSGGGGGGVSVKSFIIDKKEIITKLKQGGSKIETITITNNGDVLLDFVIGMENLQ